MNLRNTILAEHSKAQKDLIVNWIGTNQKRFDELFRIVMDDHGILAQRAAWPMSYAVEFHPELIQKHFARLFFKLKKPQNHSAITRNMLRLLTRVTIPARFQGMIMDYCFDRISDPNEKPANKAFSLVILQNLALQFPDIASELKLIIHDQWDQATPAFKASARKILQSLNSPVKVSRQIINKHPGKNNSK